MVKNSGSKRHFLGLTGDVLRAAVVDLAPRPRTRAPPARPKLARRVAPVDLAGEPRVQVQIEVVLQSRVERLAPDQVDRVLVRAVRLVDEVGERLELPLVVPHEDGRDADGQVRRRAREQQVLERRDGAVVEAGQAAHGDRGRVEAVERDRDAEGEVCVETADRSAARAISSGPKPLVGTSR